MINITDSKPLIYKKNMKNNWRFQSKEVLVNNNLIHFIDLVTYNFKTDIYDLKLQSSRSLKDLKIFDTISASLRIENILANICISYGTIVEKKILIYYSNGKVEITNNNVNIYYPGRLKSKNFNYLKPKIYKKYKIRDLSRHSLNNSVKYFLNKVKYRKRISKFETNKSIKSNIICIKLSNYLKKIVK